MKIEQVHIEYISAHKAVCTEEGARHIKTLPWFSVVASIKGQYGIALDGRAEQLTQEGGCFLAPSGAVQNIVHHRAGEQPMEMQWVFMDMRINGLYKPEDLFTFPVVLAPERAAPFNACINEMLGLREEELQDAVKLRRLGFSVAEQLLPLGTPKERVEESILPALRMIRSRYGEQLTVSQMAEACHLSVSTFLRTFRRAAGHSPAAYLGELRLAVASSLLITTGLPVGEIASRTGFYDQFYFSRCFKEKYGATPTEYRRKVSAEP